MINNNENVLPLQFNESIKNVNIGQNPFLENFVENKNNNFINENNLGNNMNINDINNNFNSIKGIGKFEEINPIDFNTMNKIKPFYLNMQNNEQNPNPLFFPIMNNNPQKQNILEAKNNFQLLNNNNELNPLNNSLNNKNKPLFEPYEFNYQDIFNNNRIRRQRRTNDSQNINNSLIQFNGINEQINNKQNNFYQNMNPEFQEQEQINELINNLKRANDKNFNVFSNMRNDNSYLNNLIAKNDISHNLINYNLNRNDNDIVFRIHSKNHF